MHWSWSNLTYIHVYGELAIDDRHKGKLDALHTSALIYYNKYISPPFGTINSLLGPGSKLFWIHPCETPLTNVNNNLRRNLTSERRRQTLNCKQMTALLNVAGPVCVIKCLSTLSREKITLFKI